MRALCCLAVLATLGACAESPPPPSQPPPAPPAASTVVTAEPPPTVMAGAAFPSTAPPPASAAPAPPPPQDAFATVHGLKMHYVRQGKGPTVVLLHGGSCTIDLCWGAALPVFAQQFDVIAPEQLGHGKTGDDPKHAMSYHTMAEDTVDLLGQLGVTSASFVGVSDGAILALDIAMHHPAVVNKLVANAANYSTSGLDPKLVAALKTMKAEDFPPPIRDAYAKVSPDGAAHWPVFFDRLRKLWLSEPKWTTKDLATIKSPSLILAGDHDLVRTQHTVEMAAAIPGAELAILPHAGHEVSVEDPARWNAAVLAFLNEAPPKAEDKGPPLPESKQ